jgi:hypothetical protein
MAGGNVDDFEEANLEDWEFRNYKDDWLPSFEKLIEKNGESLQGNEVQQIGSS